MSSSYKGADLVAIRDFSRDQIEHIMDLAEKMVPIALGQERSDLLAGYVQSSLFFEPSTRTRLSFASAMARLGGATLGFDQPGGSSVQKGETLADTIKMVDSYSDVIVLRHHSEGSARLAAYFAEKPVINAGDGAGQHPTQTILDLFTIRKAKGKIDGVNVALVGDLKYGRTAHSLAEALALFGAELMFVAPANLQMPKETIRAVDKLGGKPKTMTSIEQAVPEADVLYITRIQKERFPDLAEYQKVAGSYKINNALLKDAKTELSIMHPLPRVDEIHPDVDLSPHALYFQQAFNGVPVRMAILALLLGVIE
ncbi:MAG: aspartate carbamoyltransferase [Thermoplasmata archaeon]|nr:aspartate carbamoyltransferase [Thermoplasmata archaeon]